MPKSLSRSPQSTPRGYNNAASVDPHGMSRFVVAVEEPDTYDQSFFDSVVGQSRSVSKKTVYRCAFPGCSRSNHRFVYRSDATRHARAHDATAHFKCPHCSHTTPQRSNLNTHIDAKHTNPKLDGRTRQGKEMSQTSKRRKVDAQHGAYATPVSAAVAGPVPCAVPFLGPWTGISQSAPASTPSGMQTPNLWSNGALEDTQAWAANNLTTDIRDDRFAMGDVQAGAESVFGGGINYAIPNALLPGSNHNAFGFSEPQVVHGAGTWMNSVPLPLPSQESNTLSTTQQYASLVENQPWNHHSSAEVADLEFPLNYAFYGHPNSAPRMPVSVQSSSNLKTFNFPPNYHY